ncbi:hypothetical protein IGI46_001834 [Enterococcus sp. AZ163]
MSQRNSGQTSKLFSFQTRHTSVLITIITVILILFSFTFFQIGKEIKKTDVMEMKNDWAFFVENHSDQQLFGENTRRIEFVDPNESLIMQQSLRQSITNPELILRANHQWVTVLLDNQIIYQYQETAKQENPGLLFTKITLPKDYYQKTLRIVTKSPFKYYAGLPAQVFLGEADEIARFFLMHSVPQMIILFICLGISLSAVVMLISRKKLNKQRIALTGLLCAFSLLVGIQSSVNNLSTGTLFTPDKLSLWYSLTSILIPIALTSYYWLRNTLYRKWYLPVIIIEYSLLATTIFSLITQQIPLPMILQVASGLNVFLTLYTAMISLLEAASDNRFYVICSPGIVMAAVIHCFFYIQLFIGAANLIIDWPMILFTALAVLICGYHFWEEYTALSKHKKEVQSSAIRSASFDQKLESLTLYFSSLIHKKNQEQTQPINLTLSILEEHYQEAFKKLNGKLTCTFSLQKKNQLLEEELLQLLIQVFEKLLVLKQHIGCDATLHITQKDDQLIIESQMEPYSRPTFDQTIQEDLSFYRQELQDLVGKKRGRYERLEHQMIIRLSQIT